MAKMSDYPSVENTEEFTQEQKAAFLGSAMCIATGSKTAGGNKVTANIPLSDITSAVPTKLSDLTDDITQQTVVANDTRPVSGAAVSSAMASFGGFQVTTIDPNTHRPAVSGTIDPKAIYLTPSGEAGTENAYDEWICTDTSVPTWEKVGVTRVDLSQYYTKGQTDTVIETAIDSIAPVQNSVLYGGGSGGFNKQMDLLYDNTLTKVSGANGYELKVAVPVPSPGLNAHRGEVLTVNNSDEAVWAAPQGGGGGNPYTKVTVTASVPTANGHKTEYDYDFYNQNVTIGNNTYSILSRVAVCEGEEGDDPIPVENLYINLAQTDFPMAVVEITLVPQSSVINIFVKNGTADLTRMYGAPYNKSVLKPSDLNPQDNNSGRLYFTNDVKQTPGGIYVIDAIRPDHISSNTYTYTTDEHASVNEYTKLQIQIFGSCFTVFTNNECDVVPAS